MITENRVFPESIDEIKKAREILDEIVEKNSPMRVPSKRLTNALKQRGFEILNIRQVKGFIDPETVIVIACNYDNTKVYARVYPQNRKIKFPFSAILEKILFCMNAL